MKKDIHGKYYTDVDVQCVCGNAFKINAAIAGPIKLESCPACHPAYQTEGTVVQKVIKGRMEKFLEKQKKIATVSSASKTPTTKKVTKK